MKTIQDINAIAERKSKIIYRDGDKVYKSFDETYSKSSILNESLNQARIEETGLNIPKITEVAIVDGKRAIVMEYIEGTTLEKMMRQNPEKIDEYLDLFVKIQLDIHSRRCPLLTKFKDKMTDKIFKSDLDASTRYDLAMRWREMPDHNSVLHCDFNPSNVIITPDGVPYIIDWSHASQGNASADVAKTYLIFELEGKKDIAEIYLKKFCKAKGTSEGYVRKWIPLIAAAQLIKGKAENREILMNHVNSVE
ncbi:MAG: aminoglycoside phosphotransferase [Clostridiales bacterium]|nr:aminoglycoside phosphotransferase [Clostridiales bacterium]